MKRYTHWQSTRNLLLTLQRINCHRLEHRACQPAARKIRASSCSSIHRDVTRIHRIAARNAALERHRWDSVSKHFGHPNNRTSRNAHGYAKKEKLPDPPSISLLPVHVAQRTSGPGGLPRNKWRRHGSGGKSGRGRPQSWYLLNSYQSSLCLIRPPPVTRHNTPMMPH
eukprot:SAG11_NODE_2094_length_3834_cov_1.595181_2_plen_168_part_00